MYYYIQVIFVIFISLNLFSCGEEPSYEEPSSDQTPIYSIDGEGESCALNQHIVINQNPVVRSDCTKGLVCNVDSHYALGICLEGEAEIGSFCHGDTYETEKLCKHGLWCSELVSSTSGGTCIAAEDIFNN